MRMARAMRVLPNASGLPVGRRGHRQDSPEQEIPVRGRTAPVVKRNLAAGADLPVNVRTDD